MSSTHTSLLTYLEGQSSAMLDDLKTLVEIESPSYNAMQVNHVLDQMETWLVGLGATAQHIAGPNGDHRHFIFPSSNPARVLILGHADTVWPMGTLERLPFRLEGGLAYGPGTYDMKGCLIQALYAIKAILHIQNEFPVTLEFLITTDEEVGSPSSRELIMQVAQGAQAVLVIEPSIQGNGNLKTSRKGGGEFWVQVQGIASHAGVEPEKGANAILELAHQALTLSSLAKPELGTTVSVGQISGGTATNVVPAYAEFHADLRVSSLEEGHRIGADVAALTALNPRTTLKITGGLDRSPFERSPQTVELFHKAQQVALELGFTVGEGGVGGMSDGNFTAPIAPTLDGLGCVGAGAHAEHEHIEISQMPPRAALLAGLILKLA
jgi:glutamate carboxypeptidase